MSPPDPRTTFRFGDFELDVAAYELRHRGRPIRLERRPMDLLILLVERRGLLVSRAEIVERLWGPGLFVDADTGVNTAVRKVRQALRDPVEAPRFVETVAGKGYRFAAEVEMLSTSSAAHGPSPSALAVAAPEAPESPSTPRAWVPARFIAAALVVGAIVGLGLWSRRTGSLGARATLAVLPFENLSGDPDRDYLADGLAEETIAALGRVDPEHLGVIGRTSTLGYKRTTKSLAGIGRELRADYLVESSIRAEGGRLRIISKLIRAHDQVQIWSASYDSEPDSMLTLQRELSAAIAEQVRLRLSPERLAALARKQTRHPEAYDLYLRGRYFWNRLTPPTTREAIRYFSRATELDPAYALAWSGIADAYVSSPINGDAAPLEALPRAREAATRAVAAEPDLAEAQTSLGMVHFWEEWDYGAAEAAFDRAMTLDPGYDLAPRTLGVMLAHAGRHAEAGRALRRAREIDPMNPMNHALSAHAAYMAREYATAVPFARQAIVVDPQFWIGHFQLAQAAEALGENDLALEELASADRLSGGNSKAIGLRGYLLARLHRTAEAREALEALESASRVRYVPPMAMALVNLGLGDREQTFKYLERALQVRDVHLVYLPGDPKWDALRREPRFTAFVERCAFGMRAARDGARSSRDLTPAPVSAVLPTTGRTVSALGP